MLPQLFRFRQWIPIPRAQAHRLVLALPNLADRQLGAAIGLQVGRLAARQSLGYCWRRMGEVQIEVWYWDESGFDIGAHQSSGLTSPQPCPESVLRNAPPEGFTLIRCAEGFEAVFSRKGQTEKTRWFAAIPSETDWAWFVQDASQDPTLNPVPVPCAEPLLDRPVTGWSFFTSLRRPFSRAALATVAGVAVLGGVVASAAVYDFKLVQAVDQVKAQRATLAQESAVAVKLQAELDEIARRVGGLSSEQAPVLQLQALARLANSRLVGEGTKVYLLEWEFRNDRVRMLFAVPQDKFALSEFLVDLEKIGVFSGIRLLPGTPGLTVGLQAGLRPVTSIAALAPIPSAESLVPATAASAGSRPGKP